MDRIHDRPVALFPPTPRGTESEGLSRALEATRLPQRAEGPSEVGEGRAGVAKLRDALPFSGQRPPQRSTIIRGRGCQGKGPWGVLRDAVEKPRARRWWGRLGPWFGLGALFDRLLVMPVRQGQDAALALVRRFCLEAAQ